MVPGMIFLFALRSLLSQRWAALKEVSAAVAAAIGIGALDLPAFTPAIRTCRPPIGLTIWRGSITL